MENSIRVLLLYGGRSSEHEISLISAASVLSCLDPSKYTIIPIGIDKNGCYYLNQYEEVLACKDALPVRTSQSRNLDSLIIDGKLAVPADVVFPIVHGPLYEDGCLQGLLELANVAFVGCTVLSSAIGMDKDVARRLASLVGIQSARYKLVGPSINNYELEKLCQHLVAEFGWPLFVKPCAMGSSVGIHKATNMSALLAGIKDARRYDEDILIEEGIEGRELELAVLENIDSTMQPKVTVAGEICVHHPDGYYSYAAKYLDSEQTELVIPANLPTDLLARLQAIAAQIFVTLKCRGMARIDFFVDEKKEIIYFNEINTIPGFTPTISMYPKLWVASGLAYADLLDALISLALKRHQDREQLVTSYR